MLGQMSHAFAAGTAIGIACGLVGYFVVLRAQVFAGDALSHVAFTGALAAAAFGVDIRLGLFVTTIVAGVGLGFLGDRARADDVVIGTLFAWTLGLGALFLSIFASERSGSNGAAAVRVLFGSILSLTGSDVRNVVVLATIAVAGLLVIARPLLFATIDASVAVARGVPVRVIGIGFLGLVGLVAAEASLAVGALLLLGLLAAPAGAALRLTADPYRGLALSTLLSLSSVWAGLALAYAFPTLPPSPLIVFVAVGSYAVAAVIGSRRS
jgi:zinc/manganese transport system permease protein